MRDLPLYAALAAATAAAGYFFPDHGSFVLAGFFAFVAILSLRARLWSQAMFFATLAAAGAASHYFFGTIGAGSLALLLAVAFVCAGGLWFLWGGLQYAPPDSA